MILLSIGAFFGAIFRYIFDIKLNKKIGYFPVGTFCVNMAGSFLIGMLFSLDVSSQWMLLFSYGFAGAFTTFSTFIMEIIRLYEDGRKVAACFYMVGSIVIGVLFATIGFLLF